MKPVIRRRRAAVALFTIVLVLFVFVGVDAFRHSPATPRKRPQTNTSTRPAPSKPNQRNTAAPASLVSPLDPGLLPQTNQKPSATSAAFQARMRSLWIAIKIDSIEYGLKAFFTLDSYLSVKSLYNNAHDYANRLLVHFALDIEAAHKLIASQGTNPIYVGVKVPMNYAAWVPPGVCYNRLGYWHVPGTRLLYSVHGVLHSIGVLSLISWRGQWYIVHLGQLNRTANIGYVDTPAIGVGSFGTPGGC
ncbi:MAG: hypothetical protein ACYDHP_05455 [Ferrimicrobium sp.]